jgi:predicted nucleic acid-binding Zn ribbon protein
VIFDEDDDPAGPAGVLREQLTDARDAGRSFDEAWPGALDAALCSANGTRGEWHLILQGMSRTWAAAFERRPVDDRQPAPAAGRVCEWCGDPIDHMRRLARFCSTRCYNDAKIARRREVLGTPTTCPNCGGSMVGRRADAIACSTTCAHAMRHRARREREKGPRLTSCVVCGGSLAHKQADAEVCSPKCRRVREKQRLGEKRRQQQLVAA